MLYLAGLQHRLKGCYLVTSEVGSLSSDGGWSIHECKLSSTHATRDRNTAKLSQAICSAVVKSFLCKLLILVSNLSHSRENRSTTNSKLKNKH